MVQSRAEILGEMVAKEWQQSCKFGTRLYQNKRNKFKNKKIHNFDFNI